MWGNFVIKNHKGKYHGWCKYICIEKKQQIDVWIMWTKLVCWKMLKYYVWPVKAVKQKFKWSCDKQQCSMVRCVLNEEK